MRLPDDVQSQLRSMYDEVLPGAVRRLRQAIETHDVAGVEREAHDLRPSASQMGEHRLAAVLADLEAWARVDGDWRHAAHLIERFETMT